MATFSVALDHMRAGGRARRALWDTLGGKVGGPVEMVVLTAPDGRATVPLLVTALTDGRLTTFTGGSWDLLADDWQLVS